MTVPNPMPRHRKLGMILVLIVLIALLVWSVATSYVIAQGAQISAPIGDPSRGASLYENQCQSCHTSTVHIRENRKGKSPSAVRRQIERWQSNLQLEWTTEEVSDVLAHLLVRYYRFDDAPTAKRD